MNGAPYAAASGPPLFSPAVHSTLNERINAVWERNLGCLSSLGLLLSLAAVVLFNSIK